MVKTNANDIVDTLNPVRRWIGLSRAARGACLGLGAGAMVAAIVVAAGRLISFSALPIAIAALGAGVVVGVALAIIRWPAPLDAARAADLRFDLHDRLTTALEFRTSTDPLPVMQRTDLIRRLEGVSLAQAGRSRPGWREGAAAIGGITVLLLALLIGGSRDAKSTAAAAVRDQTRIRQVTGAQVPRIVHRVEQGLTPAQRRDPALRKLQSSLARLQHQLAHAANRAAALRAISATQQQLHRIASSLHPINSHAVAQLNSALKRYMSAQERAAASAGKRQSLSASAQLLRRLAASLKHLSAAQRARLAQALARAANATSDKQLRAALHQAASSLAYHDPQTAAQSLQQAAQALEQTPGAQQTQQAISSTTSQLDQLKGKVSGINSQGQSATSNGQPSSGTPSGAKGGAQGQGQQAGSSRGQGKGQGQGQGQGKGQGQGQGQGKGQGNGRGQGRGQGNGQGSGRLGTGSGGKGAGQGSGSSGGKGGTGGHGIGGGRGNAGPRAAGRYATVYAPGQQRAGPHSIQNGGPSGRPAQGPIVPYQQVIGQYSSAAHTALDRASLPPSVSSYVRQYFSTVSR